MEDIFMEICARLSMNLRNKISDLEAFAMSMPLDLEVKSFTPTGIKSLKLKYFKSDFNVDLYPADIVLDARKQQLPPKCIFVPDRKILRAMIKAVVLKPEHQTDYQFLLRFSLLDNALQYL
jgi:hypothetical protein